MNKTTIEDIRNSLKEIERKYPKKKNDLGFNLFSIMNVQEKELIHSRFIEELLNPSGSHGQQKIFLELFFKIVLKQNTTLENNGLKTLSEKSFDYVKEYKEESVIRRGFIDLLIRYIDTDRITKKCIIIENKIYAGDQQNQLLRYYDAALDGEIYGENGKSIIHHYLKKDIEILYLTLDGHEPSQYSFGDKDNSADCKKLVKCISYQDHIIPWIEECKKSIEGNDTSNLHNALSQYIEILKSLIVKQSENKYKAQVLKLFAEDENYKFLSQLNSTKGSILDKYWHYIKCKTELFFWEEVEIQIKAKNWELIDSRKYSWEQIIANKKWYGLRFKIDSDSKYCIYIERGEGRPYYRVLEIDDNKKATEVVSKDPIKDIGDIDFKKFDNKTHELFNADKRKELVEGYLKGIKMNY